MGSGHVTVVFILAVLALVASLSLDAYEVYHWIDENGVQNFSSERPNGDVQGLRKLDLPDTAPTDIDPDEDRYRVKEQAERMSALRAEMAKRREANRERELRAAQQQPVQYIETTRGYAYPYWYPPVYPKPPTKPPHKPRPPIVVPYSPMPQAPPGRSPGRVPGTRGS